VEETLLATFREIMAIEVDDGVRFDLKGLKIEAIMWPPRMTGLAG
jgi:hypothetical protein